MQRAGFALCLVLTAIALMMAAMVVACGGDKPTTVTTDSYLSEVRPQLEAFAAASHELYTVDAATEMNTTSDFVKKGEAYGAAFEKLEAIASDVSQLEAPPELSDAHNALSNATRGLADIWGQKGEIYAEAGSSEQIQAEMDAWAQQMHELNGPEEKALNQLTAWRDGIESALKQKGLELPQWVFDLWGE